MANGYQYLEKIEKHAGLLGICIALMVSLGGLAEITPLFMRAQAITPDAAVKPYDPLRLAGRDIYRREGCYVCHTQMVRALSAETRRYGPYSVSEESVYDRPHQWGSKRTGPDLARIGGKYSDDWQRLHLMNPRTLVPASNMPGYPWLADEALDAADITERMRALRRLGDPYSEADIDAAPATLEGRTAMDALVAYLQGLGTTRPPVPDGGAAP